MEAYNILYRIYEKRGYRSRDIPQLILSRNLFGLDIDDRAAQLAGFALLMRARQDDRRLFSREIQLNLHALQEADTSIFPSCGKPLTSMPSGIVVKARICLLLHRPAWRVMTRAWPC